MQEHSTSGFVLDIEPSGESDLRVHLFTKSLGRVVALARSARKPTSKLAGHIQPLSLVTVRLVERRGMQLVDALAISTINELASASDKKIQKTTTQIGVAHLILKMTDLHQPDAALWQLIEKGDLATAQLLRVLGFDPLHSHCSQCNKSQPEHFLIRESIYMCSACLNRGSQISPGIQHLMV